MRFNAFSHFVSKSFYLFFPLIISPKFLASLISAIHSTLISFVASESNLLIPLIKSSLKSFNSIFFVTLFCIRGILDMFLPSKHIVQLGACFWDVVVL